MDDFFGDDAWGEEPEWVKHGADRNQDGTSQDREDERATPVVLGAQHVLLLVDCHASMFSSSLVLEPSSSQACPADLALYLAQHLMQQRIRDTVTLKIGNRNGVGVILFDTKPLQDHPTRNKSSDTMEYQDEEPPDEDDDEEDEDETPARHVHVLLPLDPPGITQVQTIRACLKGDRLWKEEFSNDNGDDSAMTTTTTTTTPRKAPLQTALEEAARIFRQAPCVRTKLSNATDPLDTRSIWILTNRENPYSHPELLQNVARDVKESGIQIMVWPLPHPSANPSSSFFSMAPLYGELVSQDVFGERRLDSEEAITEGLDALQQYWKKLRRLYWGPILLPGEQLIEDKETETDDGGADSREEGGKGLHIMVDWFRFVQLAKKPARVQIDQQTKRETIKLKQYFDKNTGDIFATIRMGDAEDRNKPKSGLKRIRQFTTFGGETIPMSDEDLDEIRLQANGGKTKPALSILGFKPKSSIPLYHTMGPAYLIYPNDDTVKGSREAFVELHAAMLRKKVLAIGEVLHRVHWSSRLVAIYPLEQTTEPSSSEDSTDSGPRSPPGMMVVTLPFEDDIRQLEEDEAWQAWVENSSKTNIHQELPDEMPSITLDNMAELNMPTEAVVQSAINLISRQRLIGMELGEDFENAALTEFFNYLENVALEVPVPELGEEFDTRPDDAMIVEVAGAQIEDFRSNLPEDLPATKSSTGTGTRKRKTELVKDDTGLDWRDLYLSDELDTVKVPQLKSYLRSVGASLSGNKSLLVERVSDHIKQSLANSTSETVAVKAEL